MSKLFEGSLPADDVVVCLIAVLVLAGFLCLLFLPTRTHPHKCLMQLGDQRVNQETYVDSPPQREMPAPLAQCKSDYNKCVQSQQQVFNQESQLTQPAQREMPGLGLRRQLVSQVQDLSDMKPTHFPHLQLPVNTSSRLR
jgi:hypothetical protein